MIAMSRVTILMGPSLCRMFVVRLRIAGLVQLTRRVPIGVSAMETPAWPASPRHARCAPDQSSSSSLLATIGSSPPTTQGTPDAPHEAYRVKAPPIDRPNITAFPPPSVKCM